MKNRGGLSKTNADTQNIFLHAEKIFRKHNISSVTCIDSKYLFQEMLHDCHIISSFKNISYSAELEVSKEITFNLLESMLLLFTRVRSFSYARDVREKHGNAKKQANKSSLRTGIKKNPAAANNLGIDSAKSRTRTQTVKTAIFPQIYKKTCINWLKVLSSEAKNGNWFIEAVLFQSL